MLKGEKIMPSNQERINAMLHLLIRGLSCKARVFQLGIQRQGRILSVKLCVVPDSSRIAYKDVVNALKKETESNDAYFAINTGENHVWTILIFEKDVMKSLRESLINDNIKLYDASDTDNIYAQNRRLNLFLTDQFFKLESYAQYFVEPVDETLDMWSKKLVPYLHMDEQVEWYNQIAQVKSPEANQNSELSEWFMSQWYYLISKPCLSVRAGESIKLLYLRFEPNH